MAPTPSNYFSTCTVNTSDARTSQSSFRIACLLPITMFFLVLSVIMVFINICALVVNGWQCDEYDCVEILRQETVIVLMVSGTTLAFTIPILLTAVIIGRRCIKPVLLAIATVITTVSGIQNLVGLLVLALEHKKSLSSPCDVMWVVSITFSMIIATFTFITSYVVQEPYNTRPQTRDVTVPAPPRLSIIHDVSMVGSAPAYDEFDDDVYHDWEIYQRDNGGFDYVDGMMHIGKPPSYDELVSGHGIDSDL